MFSFRLSLSPGACQFILAPIALLGAISVSSCDGTSVSVAPTPVSAHITESPVDVMDQVRRTPLFNDSPEGSDNLLSNGGFESGDTDWSFCEASEDRSARIVSDAYEGTGAYSVPAGNCLYQTIVIEPGTDLILSCYVKIENDIEWTGLGLGFSDANWQELDNGASTFVTASDYTRYDVRATAPVNARYASMWFYTDTAATIDHCTLSDAISSPVPPAPDGDNLLVNASFENVSNNMPGDWVNYCDGEAMAGSRDGNSVLTLGGGACVAQSLSAGAVEALKGKEAVLSCDVDYTGTEYAEIILNLDGEDRVTAIPANSNASIEYRFEAPQELLSGFVSIYSEGSANSLTVSECSLITADNSNVIDNNNTPENENNVEPVEVDDAEKPNILLIITDDQGLDTSSQYAYSDDLPNTPVLDQLAADGIVFDNFWATPSCTTTRGSLITGKHGVNSGVDNTPEVLDTDRNYSLQSHLSTGSYATSVFGKWHLAGGREPILSNPNDAGVEHYAGNINNTSDYFNWELTVNGSAEEVVSEYHTSAITDMAIDWISEQDGPWFSWVAYYAPHSPFHLPPSELHNRSLSGTNNHINNNSRDYFLAAIEAVDTEIGRMLQSIPEAERENTIVMVIGDNGTPGRIVDTSAFDSTQVKGSLYEGGIRVPFIVSGAGVTRRGEREAALANSVDVYATLSDATGLVAPSEIDGQSFHGLLTSANHTPTRAYNYSEYISDSTDGWVVRDNDYKLIEFSNGRREVYDMRTDIREANNLVNDASLSSRIAALDAFAQQIRSGSRPDPQEPQNPQEPQISDDAIDISNVILQNDSGTCADYANTYTSTVLDVNSGQQLMGNLRISVENGSCVFSTNSIPNHDLNDGDSSFPNPVSAQEHSYTVTTNPAPAESVSPLLLTQDNAILLNGVKVDLLAAGCFGVGDGRIGCNDPDQPWRYDPMHPASGFRVDSHNAHTQPDGSYHYHGSPNALFNQSDTSIISPVIGFAADGFPIFGSYFNDNGTIRKAISGYRLKSSPRPTGNGNPGGTPDGTYRDDYEYVEGAGDLDECNGMTVNDVYGYYLTDEFPYVLACFTGTPDDSFLKSNNR